MEDQTKRTAEKQYHMRRTRRWKYLTMIHEQIDLDLEEWYLFEL